MQKEVNIFYYDGFLASKDFKMIWLSNIFALSLYDECYSRSASCAYNL